MCIGWIAQRWMVVILFLGTSIAAAQEAPIDFSLQVQPILKAHCYPCHGPDKQKSGLRLDVRKAALQGGDSGPVLEPGKPESSLLFQRIASKDANERMPPDGPGLTNQQRDVLRTWIAQGARWPESNLDATPKDKRDWWSLKPIRRPAVPVISTPGVVLRNPIDAFIVEKLREKRLAPSPEADRRTLIRRLSFDLLGLPPDPNEVDRFVNDPDPLAYEKLVDRYLASSHYGERWARHWLDVVHYGDTHGYDKDKPRPNAWPYRDYVIRSFNTDKPYARFVQEQIAGDFLFPQTTDGIVATGFLAAGPWDLIGHTEVPENKTDGKIARLLDRDDMVSNTLNTFMSVTVQCARCHHHKFDPIDQEEYYRLQAVFAAIDRADRPYHSDPTTVAKLSELQRQRLVLLDQRKKLETSIQKQGGAELAKLDRAIERASRENVPPRTHAFGYHSAIESHPDRTKWIQVDLGQPTSVKRVMFVGCYDTFNNIGAGFGFPARFKIEGSDDPRFEKHVRLIVDHTREDFKNPGTTPQEALYSGEKVRYVRFTATKLALRQKDYIFALAELQIFDDSGENVATRGTITAFDSIEAPPRWRKANLTDGYYFGIQKNTTLAELEKQRQALLGSLVEPRLLTEFSEIEKAVKKVDEQVRQLPSPQLVYAGTVHHGSGAFTGTGPTGGKPRPIHVLIRGDVNRPAKEVQPGTFRLRTEDRGVFDLPIGAPEGERRAALAKWITDPLNPLTWRSIVNRVWLYHFGRGIVDSPNDFGHMGQQPSHPELLDWLASEFCDRGGSFKHIHRLIVTSAVYRQSSSASHEGMNLDAENRYLGRMNRRKLEAEAIRDAILVAAGKMHWRMGGPGFQDFIIEKPEHSPHYQYHLYDPSRQDTHRRSIYRFIVRSQPQPFLTTLDCADPSMSVDKRNETLTALQALALLNNRFVVQMAHEMAEQVEAKTHKPDAQVEEIFRRALSRLPDPKEKEIVKQYLLAYGVANTCRIVLNLNEFTFVD